MLDIELSEDHNQPSACCNLFRCSSYNQVLPNLLKFLFEFQLFMVDQVRLLNLISMEDGNTHNECSKGFTAKRHQQLSPKVMQSDCSSPTHLLVVRYLS